MSLKQNDTYREKQYEEREMWLLDMNSDDLDVMEDERGEYIMYESEDEAGTNQFHKKYLPVELQRNYVPEYSF